MSFGSRLRYLIDKKGITPYQISQETGISQATFSRLLGNSTVKPSIKNTEILATYFNIDQTWLLTGEGEMLKTTNQLPTMRLMTGFQLKEVIRRGGITQEEAAARLGITRRTLQNWFAMTELDANISQKVKESLDVTDGAPQNEVAIQLEPLFDTIRTQARTIEDLTSIIKTLTNK